MKRPLIRVSGARVGDAVRPVADAAATALPRKRFGLRVNASALGTLPPPSASTPAESIIEPDDEVAS